MKNSLLVIMSTIISLFCFVVLIEIVLRKDYENWKEKQLSSKHWLGGLTKKSDNETLMWEYKPNSKSNLLGVPNIKTNRYGFRGEDFKLKRSEKKSVRVSFIGDSVTLGLKVAYENTFSYKLTRNFKSNFPNKKLVSMNHGIDGYNTIQISELLKTKVLRFKPDQVVYVMCLNDFDFKESSGGKIRFFKKPDMFFLEKLDNFYKKFIKVDFHVWHFEKNKSKVFREIIKMKKLLESKKIEFKVVIVPIFSFDGSERNWELYQLSKMHLSIGSFLRKNHIDFMDLLGFFEVQEKPPKSFAHDIWHPNDEGHEFMARKIFHFLFHKS